MSVVKVASCFNDITGGNIIPLASLLHIFPSARALCVCHALFTIIVTDMPQRQLELS